MHLSRRRIERRGAKSVGSKNSQEQLRLSSLPAYRHPLETLESSLMPSISNENFLLAYLYC